MLIASAMALSRALPDSIVVIQRELLAYTRQLEQLGLRVVINEQAECGMGGSIACGVGASQDATGWLIALADMPYLKTDTITLLADRLQNGATIIAPQYGRQRGHPVGFSRPYRQELLALRDDIGARNILQRHQQQLELVPTDDAGVITDVDRPSDVSHVERMIP